MSSTKVRAAPTRSLRLGAGVSQSLFGAHDDNLRVLERDLEVRISARDDEVFLEGEEHRVEVAARVIAELGVLASRGETIGADRVRSAARVAAETPATSLQGFADVEVQTAKGRFVRPKGPNQRLYIEAIRAQDIVFAIGPAGTGKTFLAMALALEAFNAGAARRIVLARPAIEAGEKLGFLPGDMYEKVNPYLRPLYDALYALMDFDRVGRLIDRSQIEIAPLAFMRGRTLSDSFVILDEAQNTTPEQMKMFLTRIGTGSRAVINGDITQVDLPSGHPSGLVDATRVLEGVEGIEHVEFDRRDVVRHPLVRKIVAAYDRAERQQASEAGSRGRAGDG